MFLRKETRIRETGSFTMIPYCKDCDSEDIEIIKTCRKCGSKNIGHPTFNDLISDDKRGMKPNTMEYDVNIYSCDKCGKEFDGLREPNVISYSDYGEFFAGMSGDYGDNLLFQLDEDLCKECTNILINDLNKQLEDIATRENIKNTMNRLFTKEGE